MFKVFKAPAPGTPGWRLIDFCLEVDEMLKMLRLGCDPGRGEKRVGRKGRKVSKALRTGGERWRPADLGLEMRKVRKMLRLGCDPRARVGAERHGGLGTVKVIISFMSIFEGDHEANS